MLYKGIFSSKIGYILLIRHTHSARRNGIRTSETLSAKLSIDNLNRVNDRLAQRLLKKSRKRLIRYGLLAINVVLLVGVVSFVVHNPNSGQAVRSGSLAALSNGDVVSPLDQLSSADIAVHLSRLASMDNDEVLAVANQADSVNVDLAIVSTGEAMVSKPQVVATNLKSRKDIQRYIVQGGDSVGSIAAKFSVTSDTIRWSNNITSEVVSPGKEIWVLPGVNGIIYVPAAGETPESLAQKYSANKDTIIAYNDAEISGLPVGERIIIPNGKPPATSRPARSYTGGFAFGSSPIYGYNGYVRGYCTYYVASKVSIPTNWGDARSWANSARASGWTVSSVPRPGAIAQTRRMNVLGHVAYVEAVSEDGSQMKYSDMNGIAGYNRVGYSDWVSSSLFEAYIYR